MKYKHNGEWVEVATDGAPGKDGAPGLNGAPGKDGKSAYEYAKEGGYTGTEEEFAQKLAEEIVIPDVSGFMNKTNPTGTGSLSLNRKAGTTIGQYSTAEGNSCTASGNNSHAEGCFCIASGTNTHAEGNSCTARNTNTHAEGNGCAAIGDSSHAEGSFCIASGSFSHVQGKFNVADSAGIYAHIVGNGSAETGRSNAHTLDWSGNAWFAGYVEAAGGLSLPGLPTADPGIAGRVWNDNGTLKISAG